jgi:hypothetical protein
MSEQTCEKCGVLTDWEISMICNKPLSLKPICPECARKSAEGTDTMSTPEAAKVLNMKPRCVRQWCERRIFPNAYKKPGSQKWIIPTADIEAILLMKTKEGAI